MSSADRFSERSAAVEQTSTPSPSQPGRVESGHGGVKPPRPTPPPRSSKTVLTTVPSASDRHSSCSPQQQEEDDQGKYVELELANSHARNVPSRPYARRSSSLRRQRSVPHPAALQGSDAQSCPSRTATKANAEAPSTFYMPGSTSDTMPRAKSRWAPSLLYSGDPVKAESTAAAQASSPRLMIIDSRLDRYEDIGGEFAIPPAPQRPPRKKKGQKETQKQELSVASVKTGIQLDQSSSTASQSTADNSLPVPKPRLKKKTAAIRSTSKHTSSSPTTTTTTTSGDKNPKDPWPHARAIPIPLPRTGKEKPARPPPPTGPTRKDRPPMPVPGTKTKSSASQQLVSVSCPADTRFDAFGEPSISPEDEDYTYVDIRNPRLFFRPKHKQLDSDSDGDENIRKNNISKSGFYMPLEQSTVLRDDEYMQVNYDSKLRRPAVDGRDAPNTSSGFYSSLTTTTMTTERASMYQSPSELHIYY